MSFISKFIIDNIPFGNAISNIYESLVNSRKEIGNIRQKEVMLKKISSQLEKVVDNQSIVRSGKIYELTEERVKDLKNQLNLVKHGLLINKDKKTEQCYKLAANVFKEAFLDASLDLIIPPGCNEHVKKLASVAIVTLGDKFLERQFQDPLERESMVALLKLVITASLTDFVTDQITAKFNEEILPELINFHIIQNWTQVAGR